jgi:hypothetical protein
VNRQCDCVVCVLFGGSEVSLDVHWLGQKGVRLFSGFPPFWLQWKFKLESVISPIGESDQVQTCIKAN